MVKKGKKVQVQKQHERRRKIWVIWLLIIIFLLVVLWALGAYTNLYLR